MKKSLIIVASFVLILLSCSKDESIVTTETTNTPSGKSLISYDSDTTFSDLTNLSPQNRVLLMQEFTGVYCYTCPLAHQITSDLIQLYPGKIAAMNVHSHFYGIYDDPNVMGNLYDFRTADGDSLVSMLGGIFSVPSAAFNMSIQSGEPNILGYTRANWMGYAANELSTSPKINIELATSFNDNNRTLKMVLKYHTLENISENLYYSIAVVENDIVDKQFVDTVVVNNYHHEHILRDMITDPKSDFLINTPSQGDTFIKVINYTVPSNWDENNIEIITYVHEKENKWSVLQTAMTKI